MEASSPVKGANHVKGIEYVMIHDESEPVFGVDLNTSRFVPDKFRMVSVQKALLSF